MSDTNTDPGYNSVMSKRNSKANSALKRCGYAEGGAIKGTVKKGVKEHEKHLHKGEKETKLKLKTGGAAEGGGSKGCMGKFARGGATNAYAAGGATKKAKKGGTTVNVIVAPSQNQPQKVPVPVPAAGAGGPPGGGMPPKPPMGAAPPPGGAMPPPPGGGMPPRPPMKSGGRVTMKAGAGSGLGRIEKAKEYGPAKRG